MVVYRVCRIKHSMDISGEGARLFGGRWNHKLTPVVYTSESRSLALLEYSVNVSLTEIPGKLSITCIEVPEDSLYELSVADLPVDWRAYPAPASTKDFGTKLLEEAIYPLIKIPSTVVPHEFNFLLNPLLLKNARSKIKAIEHFVYDMRIKQG